MACRFGDHPRMCGKDTNYTPKMLKRSGSPPHVRERHGEYHNNIPPCGITPACAGKTCRS